MKSSTRMYFACLLLPMICSFSLYGKTLYVATNGSGTDGLTWQTAFTTIQTAVDAAVSQAVTDPNDVTILVGSEGTGHGTGSYTENVDIPMPLILQTESGPESTFLFVVNPDDHAINITANNVTINGFNISGAAGWGVAGIAIQNAYGCLIENNIIHHDGSFGIDMNSSSMNTIRNNQISNYVNNSAIRLVASLGNVITRNICTDNSVGIEIGNSSNANSVTDNLFSGNSTNIKLAAVSRNQITRNTSAAGTYGIRADNPGTGNRVYLNNFAGNTVPAHADFSSVLPYSWHSPTPLGYFIDSQTAYASSIGSYYGSAYTGTDADGDGIGDTAYTGMREHTDEYPLMNEPNFYAVQAWYLAGNNQMTMEPNQIGMEQTLSAGGSSVWLSQTVALEEITFAAADSSDGWNGQVWFSASAASNFDIEIGYADPNDGIFVGSGAAAILNGTSNVFTFETAGQSFSVPAGKSLAVQITNNGNERLLYLGGAWSYISAPSGTDIAWPGTSEQPPLPPANPGDLSGDGWVDMDDIAWLSIRWGRDDCEELNNYCECADIDKSGDVGLSDLEILTTFWLMGPEDLLAGDWNEDFKVNMDDMALLSDAWTGDLNQLVDLCENWLKGCYLQPDEEPGE